MGGIEIGRMTTSEERESITLGADVGGKDAHVATNEHILALRKLLREECCGGYSTNIKEFSLVLRIDGCVQAWGMSGADNFAYRKKSSYATADIYLPKDAWEGKSPNAFRRVLASEVKGAINRLAEYIQGQGISVAIDDLNHDIDQALGRFLA